MKTTGIVIGIVAVIAIIIGVSSSRKHSVPADSMKSDDMMVNKDAMMKDNNMMEGDVMNKDAMMKSETGDAMPQKEGSMSDTMMNTDKTVKGMYTDYTPDKLALADSAKVVLFFHASWCPTCRSADATIMKNGVKDGYVILKVDYDTSADLKKKYGVTTQHTFVQVDAKGNMITSWRGGQLDELYKNVK